jgi:hypothetical protein
MGISVANRDDLSALPDENTQVATPKGRSRQETEAKRRLIYQLAAATLIDPRTINKFLSGDEVQPAIRTTLQRAMKSL